MIIGVTGANGFIGKSLIYQMQTDDIPHRLFFRESTLGGIKYGDKNSEIYPLGDLRSNVLQPKAFEGVDCVVHLAGISKSPKKDKNQDLIDINVRGAYRIAQNCFYAGVKRLIFLSSIKVLGEKTKIGQKFDAYSKTNPSDIYAQSKYLAEMELLRFSEKTGLDLVIIRPPMVYGPDNQSNFAKLYNLVRLGVPLPLGNIQNKRSFVSTFNLANFIFKAAQHPDAPGQKFLISDDEDISTTNFVKKIALALNKPDRLFSVSPIISNYFFDKLSKKSNLTSLISNLEVDITESKKLLNWHPLLSVSESIQKCVEISCAGR